MEQLNSTAILLASEDSYVSFALAKKFFMKVNGKGIPVPSATLLRKRIQKGLIRVNKQNKVNLSDCLLQSKIY